MTPSLRTSEIFRAVAALLASSFACAAADLEGHVLNAITGTPLRHAVVELSNGAAAETDAEGRFAFPDLKGGQYLLTALRDGFLKGGYGPRRYVPSPIALADDEHPTGVVIRLTPGSVISGRILDETGEPVPDLEVSAIRPKARQQTPELIAAGGILTNDRGEFRIAKLEPGRYLVRTGRQGPIGETIYPAMFYPASQEQSRAVAVQVPPGGEARGIDITLMPAKGYRVRGKIINKPKDQALIAWEREGAFRHMAGYIAPDVSTFELHGMTPGRYTIYAEPDQDTTSRSGGRQTVDVSDRNVDGVVITLVAATDIPGRVRVQDATVPPDLKKLSIEAHTSAIFFPPAVTVNETGAFTLKDMVAGRFGVDVTGLPENCFVKSILFGSVEMLDSTAEVNGSTLEIILSATAGTIAGRITGKDVRPIPHATAVLLDGSGTLVGSVESDDSATFRFTSLKPGDYKLLAVDVKPGSEPDAESLQSALIRAEKVTVEANSNTTVELKTDIDPG